jgi:hypothetical protein
MLDVKFGDEGVRPVAFLSALLLLPALPTEAGRVPTVPSDSCVAPELRAAAFRVISAEDATPFLQAMHRCVVVRPMAPKAALRRT